MRRIVIRRNDDVKNFDEVEATKLKHSLDRVLLAEKLRAVTHETVPVKNLTLLAVFDDTKEVVDHIAASEVLESIESCWDRDDEMIHELTQWEQDFLDSLGARAEAGKAVSVKQLAVLRRIVTAEDRNHGR